MVLFLDCTLGDYGADCQRKCSSGCLDKRCNQYTGICSNGCSSEYMQTDYCNESKINFYYEK